MGVGYQLVNQSMQEVISFAHLPVNTRHEIVSNPVASALVAWYLFKNPGCHIHFVSDTYEDWPFPIGSKSEISTYRDVTDDLIAELVGEGILRDDGLTYVDEEDPTSIYIRAISHLGIYGA